MKNNDIIRRLRFIVDVDDTVLQEFFRLGGCHLSLSDIADLLTTKTDSPCQECTDEQLTRFLDGFIIYRRGPSKEGLRNPVALNNNVIMKKVRIALALEARDLDNAFMLTDCEVSAHEISALFRKPGTKHFVECTDEVLEKFFNGLSLYYRA